MKKLLFYLASVLLTLSLLVSCTGEDSRNSQNATISETEGGLISFFLAPYADETVTATLVAQENPVASVQPAAGTAISSVLVSFDGIELHHEVLGWLLFSEEANTIELIGLTNLSELVGTRLLQAGHYSQIRLRHATSVAIVDNEAVSLTVPSGEIKFVSGFDVSDNQETQLTISFDAERSVVLTGNPNQAKLKPVIRLQAAYSPRPRFTLSLGSGEAVQVIPWTAEISDIDFFGFESCSAKGLYDRGITAYRASKTLLYEDQTTGDISVLFVHNTIDPEDTTDVVDELKINIAINGSDDISALGQVVVADDAVSEFQTGRNPEGQWRWLRNRCSDGGVLRLNAGSQWSVDLNVEDSLGLESWKYVDASGVEHDLDLDSGMTVTLEKHY